MTPFEAEASGKWILAGEHAVLRGSPALVFPLKSRTMKLREISPESSLRVEFQGLHGGELEPLFWAVLERACDLVRTPKSSLRGRLVMESNLPIGAGLGASAAFCVVMTRWFQHLGFVQKNQLADFATTLENLFHGESSGVDIAVALSGEGLHFERSGRQFALVPRWEPEWYISYTGQRGVTSEAVKKVKELISTDPDRGQTLDAGMAEAVAGCERALSLGADEGFLLLKESIQKANACFEAWGLSQGAVKQHLSQLQEFGAAAVKPTGSGGGGYVLSLWAKTPPAEILSHLIRC